MTTGWLTHRAARGIHFTEVVLLATTEFDRA